MIYPILTIFLSCVGIVLLSLNHRRKLLTIQAEQIRKQQEILTKQREHLESMHRLQHDVQNHFLVIDGMIQRGEKEKALAYIDAYLAEIQKDSYIQK